MASVNDSNNPGTGSRGSAFPVDRPVEALIRDHNLVRKLADKYLNSDHPEVKKQCATQILQALHMHSQLEESVFYPAVRAIDPGMIAHFEQDHQQVDDMLASLRGMSLDDQRTDGLMRELIKMVMDHVQQEENDFFPKLERAGMDLTQVGLQMAAFEANLVHMQAQASDQGMRRR
ncbi:hemerythrin domain-containing protein [Massilia niastensis]|uniref:hemerythrin domain-containing protein n=1 Tax=Massilia niastensis TaxID=544911 RepID=UPI000363571D|nr:hemerythrin domain-containing protein [Massilia niastensis]